MNRLMIAGAVYYSPTLDYLVIPKTTGELSVVECERFMQESDIRNDYANPERWIVENGKRVYNHVDYYHAETFIIPTTGLELLSDLSSLTFIECNKKFNKL